MTQTDSKRASQLPVPPPYDSDPSSLPPDPFTRPRNNVLISRTFGSLRGARFTIDPNIHLPASLLPQPRSRIFEKPPPNLELSVDFGAIDAEVHVLPFAEPAEGDADAEGAGSRDGDDRDDDLAFISFGDSEPRCETRWRKKTVHIATKTTTGSIALRVHAQPAAPVAVHAASTFGGVRVYLPRTLHGPLALTSTLRAPRLSPALRRACTPLREADGATHWFVGDIDAWRARGERGDAVSVGSEFGGVWVGYVGEESDAQEGEAARARRRAGARALMFSVLLMLACWFLLTMTLA
ncbi:hypothetical protein GGX14DRAFT_456920 [Mycena pura]|uniref:DUF7330 domain-containing protein n=1 Tax=Mycena pura TaxID=153505 RepID=A0AAD6VAS1_9AGAR|nr:hypothetical protein GGX14DRAFT_456920 [Mycena pura]